MDSIWKNKEKILEGIKNSLVKNSFVDSIAEDRLKICKACSNYSTNCVALVSTCCKICGCSLSFKTKSLSSSCPINKWPSIKNG